MEWTEENCLQLISAYEMEELLWNAKHSQHFNKLKRQDGWSKIASKLNCDVDSCKKKMTALLASMRGEKSKVKKSAGTGKGADEIYSSSWFAFKRMQFLWDKDKPVETKNTASLEEASGSEAEAVLTEDLTDEHTSQNVNIPQTTPKAVMSRKKKVEEQRLDKAFDILKGCAQSSKAVPADECDDFGNFIAKKLRKYNECTRSYIQSQIMTIFLNVDTGYNQTQNHWANPANEQPTAYFPPNPPQCVANQLYEPSTPSLTHSAPTTAPPSNEPPSAASSSTAESPVQDVTDDDYSLQQLI